MPVLYEDEQIIIYQAEVWSDGVLTRVKILVMPKKSSVLGQTQGDLLVDVQLTNMGSAYSMDSFIETKLADAGVSPSTPFIQWPDGLLFASSCQQTQGGGLMFELSDYFLVHNADTDILLCAMIQVSEPDSPEPEGHTVRIKFRRDSRKMQTLTINGFVNDTGNPNYLVSGELAIQNCRTYVTDDYLHLFVKYAADAPVGMYIDRTSRRTVQMIHSMQKASESPGMFVTWMTLNIPDASVNELLYITLENSSTFSQAQPAVQSSPPPSSGGSWGAVTTPALPTPYTWGQQPTEDPFDWIKNPIFTPDPYGGAFRPPDVSTNPWGW